jgi:hypothetical protein
MSGKYYILQFDDSEEGKKLQFDLAGSPNGTIFEQGILHQNSDRNIWILWARNMTDDEEKSYNKMKGVIIIPTTMTYRLIVNLIAKGLGETEIKRENKVIKQFIINIFQDFVPNANLQ